VDGGAVGAEPAAEADFVVLGFFSGQGVEASPEALVDIQGKADVNP